MFCWSSRMKGVEVACDVSSYISAFFSLFAEVFKDSVFTVFLYVLDLILFCWTSAPLKILENKSKWPKGAPIAKN